MKMRISIFILGIIFSPGMIASAETLTSTQEDQANVEVTVYNNNLGLIKDTRKVTLPVAQGELKFMDVAAFINPVTVHAKSLNTPEKFAVLEQNYEYDLIDQNKLLDKYVGKKIKILNWNPYQDKKEIVDAKLISNNNGQVYEIGNEIYLGHPGVEILPQLPENLIAKPTLMWLFNNTSSQPHQLEVSYLTNNLSWKADYVLVVDQKDAQGDLSGWVTVDNQSGAAYKEAKLKLVAGEVQTMQQANGGIAGDMLRVLSAPAAAPQFSEQGFFEYHIYDLARRTTIKDKETKQISLLEANGIKIQKELLVYGVKSYFTAYYRPENPKQPVDVYIKFKNSKENQLGMPLPGGIIRLYKEDSAKSLQFIGENKIEHTPKDEEVKLKVGEAFDVVAERRQMNFQLISNQVYESEWEVTLRNHKQEDTMVGIIEPLSGDWQVISESHPHQKLDAFTIRYDVNVPKDGEVKVTYRIRVRVG